MIPCSAPSVIIVDINAVVHVAVTAAAVAAATTAAAASIDTAVVTPADLLPVLIAVALTAGASAAVAADIAASTTSTVGRCSVTQFRLLHTPTLFLPRTSTGYLWDVANVHSVEPAGSWRLAVGKSCCKSL